VLIRGEENAIPVTRPIRRIRHRADTNDVRRFEERETVLRREALAAVEAFRDRMERGIADESAIDGGGRVHRARHSRTRRTASVTLWPPKPKLLLSAISTSRRTARFAV